MASLSGRIALIAAVAVFAAGTTGCRRVRRLFHRRHPAAVHAAHVVHAPVPVHHAGPADQCEGARETAAANHTLRAAGSIEQVAIASAAQHTVILASVGGAMTSATLDGSELIHVGAGVAEDHESDPSIVPTRSGFAGVWRRSRAGNQYLVLQFFEPSGLPSGDEHTEQLDDGRSGAAIGAADHSLALAYVTGGAIRVQLADEHGGLSTIGALLPGSSSALGIDLVWLSPAYLATWTTQSGESATITVAQVDPADGVVRPLSALQVHSAHAHGRLIAAGNRFFMAMFDPATDANAPNVFSTAYEGSGVRIVDPQPLGDHAVESAPAVAYDGHHVAMAWTEEIAPGTTRARWVRLNDRAERVGDPLDVAGSTHNGGAHFAAALSWDGDAFVLARGGATADTLAIHRFGSNGCDAR